MNFIHSNGNGGSAESVHQTIPKHVAIIMDGNGRWAQSKGLPRLEGHRAGVKTVQKIVEEARKLGVRYLTLFAFSTENWQRPSEEVGGLMKIFQIYLKSELKRMCENGVRLRIIGNRTALPKAVVELMEETERKTVDNTGLDLVLAISYGGRNEIVQAVQKLAKRLQADEIQIDDISEKLISDNLYAPDIPDPDLLIRTSGEHRISNFLLWQLAYSEIFVTPVAWPDFSETDFNNALQEYAGRQRRYGLTGEQLQTELSAGA